MEQVTHQRNVPIRQLFGGLLLILVGGTFLAHSLGIAYVAPFWKFWSLIPLGFGLVAVLFPKPGEKRGGAFWLLGAGVYLTMANFEIAGVEYRSGWPIVLIFGGLGIIYSAVFERDTTPVSSITEEGNHGK